MPYLISPDLQILDIFINCHRVLGAGLCGKKEAKNTVSETPRESPVEGSISNSSHLYHRWPRP
jgi:hypothetical protein